MTKLMSKSLLVWNFWDGQIFIVSLSDALRELISEHKRRFNPSELKDFVDMFFYEREKGNGKHNHVLTVQNLKAIFRLKNN